jgi:hypothetical protein
MEIDMSANRFDDHATERERRKNCLSGGDREREIYDS